MSSRFKKAGAKVVLGAQLSGATSRKEVEVSIAEKEMGVDWMEGGAVGGGGDASDPALQGLPLVGRIVPRSPASETELTQGSVLCKVQGTDIAPFTYVVLVLVLAALVLVLVLVPVLLPLLLRFSCCCSCCCSCCSCSRLPYRYEQVIGIMKTAGRPIQLTFYKAEGGLAETQRASFYEVVKTAALRATGSMDSKRVGSLQKGERVQVMGEEIVEGERVGNGGARRRTVRVRCGRNGVAAGWTSVINKEGVPLLVSIAETDKARDAKEKRSPDSSPRGKLARGQTQAEAMLTADVMRITVAESDERLGEAVLEVFSELSFALDMQQERLIQQIADVREEKLGEVNGIMERVADGKARLLQDPCCDFFE